MADYLFVSQDMIDSWLMEGKIDFSGTVMSIRGEPRAYNLEPAVRFVRVAGDEADGPGLVAKVKTLEQVTEMGGEHYHDSVVLGDVAYDVQNGFIARIHLPGSTDAEASPTSAPKTEPAEVEAEIENRAKTDATPAARAGSREDEVARPAGPGSEGEESDEDLLTRFLLENLR